MSVLTMVRFQWLSPPQRGGPTLIARWLMRALGLPLVAKVAGANVLIVVGALATAMVLHRSTPQDRGTLAVLALSLAGGLAVNLALVTVALRPLRMLESTATRIRRGDLHARMSASPLADRTVRRVGDAINLLLDELMADRARSRRLAAEVIRAGDDERARLARELHDSTAQTLSAVVMQLAAAIRTVEPPELAARLETVRGDVADALEEVRVLSHTVHPRVLDDLGLPAALRHLGREMEGCADVPIVIDAPPTASALSPASAPVLYRVAQEAISNALRHGAPTVVEVFLRFDDEAATVEVMDDGEGFDAGAASRTGSGLGIFSMRERVALVDGVFELVSG